jgi:acid phosphatase class B
MEFSDKKHLSLRIIPIFLISLYACRNETVRVYTGRNETTIEAIALNLKKDYSFKMSSFAEEHFRNKPQKVLTGTWKIDGNQLKLTTKNNKIIYGKETETITMAGKTFTLETFAFKTCEKDFFASNINFIKTSRKIDKTAKTITDKL